MASWHVSHDDVIITADYMFEPLNSVVTYLDSINALTNVVYA